MALIGSHFVLWTILVFDLSLSKSYIAIVVKCWSYGHQSTIDYSRVKNRQKIKFYVAGPDAPTQPNPFIIGLGWVRSMQKFGLGWASAQWTRLIRVGLGRDSEPAQPNPCTALANMMGCVLEEFMSSSPRGENLSRYFG